MDQIAAGYPVPRPVAVTFCDLVAGRENNLKRLQARLETSAKPHFRGICFIANGDLDPAAAASRNKVLFVQIQFLAQQFAAERFGKAMAIAHVYWRKRLRSPAPEPNLSATALAAMRWRKPAEVYLTGIGWLP